MTVSRAVACAVSLLALAACGGEDEAKSEPLNGAALGEREFRACAICHTTAPRGTKAGDIRLIGPNLHGIVGRPAGSLSDFAYTRAMRDSGLVWDEATLDAFIEKPQAVVRGTRMSYLGETDPEARKAIIEYLKTLQ